jgi:hypothetical protein
MRHKTAACKKGGYCGQARIRFGPFLIMIRFLKQQFLTLFTLARSAKSTSVTFMLFLFFITSGHESPLLDFVNAKKRKNILI